MVFTVLGECDGHFPKCFKKLSLSKLISISLRVYLFRCVFSLILSCSAVLSCIGCNDFLEGSDNIVWAHWGLSITFSKVEGSGVGSVCFLEVTFSAHLGRTQSNDFPWLAYKVAHNYGAEAWAPHERSPGAMIWNASRIFLQTNVWILRPPYPTS